MGSAFLLGDAFVSASPDACARTSFGTKRDAIGGSKILHVLCSLSSNPRKRVNRAHSAFCRWGNYSLLFAKFVPGLDGFTLPLAEMEGCGMPAFVLLDAIGSLRWSGAYVVVGYLYREAGTLR
jgi:membrane protein DedA with SNARE-associated domain